MDTPYETVMDTGDMLWLALAYGVHGAMSAAQLGLALYLIASGAGRLLGSGTGTQLARGLGATRIGLGLLLVLPLLVGTPSVVSLVAAVAALVLLVVSERGRPAPPGFLGRAARATAIACAAITPVFIVWEREDGLALGVELITTMRDVRAGELEWQLASDRDAPKVGDLAPDFELQGPSGVTRVRLSDFRGERPVALVFGSYT